MHSTSGFLSSSLSQLSPGYPNISTTGPAPQHHTFPKSLLLLSPRTINILLCNTPRTSASALTQTSGLEAAQLTHSVISTLTRKDSVSKVLPFSLKQVSTGSVKFKDRRCNWKPPPRYPRHRRRLSLFQTLSSASPCTLAGLLSLLGFFLFSKTMAFCHSLRDWYHDLNFNVPHYSNDSPILSSLQIIPHKTTLPTGSVEGCT